MCNSCMHGLLYYDIIHSYIARFIVGQMTRSFGPLFPQGLWLRQVTSIVGDHSTKEYQSKAFYHIVCGILRFKIPEEESLISNDRESQYKITKVNKIYRLREHRFQDFQNNS